MDTPKPNINQQNLYDSPSTNDTTTTTDVIETGCTEKDIKSKILNSFIEHITDLFKKFSKEDGSLRNPDNQELIDQGRDEEERQQIEEFCKDLDEEKRLLEELQAFKSEDQNNTVQEWLRLKGKDELKDCTPEEKEELLMFVNEQQEREIQGQAEALKYVIENAAVTDSENNVKEAEDE